MKRPNELAHDEAAMSTLVEISSVFEGIASMRIAQTKSRVLESTKFFNELWNIYSQLRVDTVFNFGREDEHIKVKEKDLYIIVTAEGGFSGDIDLKLVELMLKTYDKEKQDVIVIGHHGAVQLALRGVGYEKYFKLPQQDQNINVAPITQIIKGYKATTVFYQEYVSLMDQQVKSIELANAVKSKANETDKIEEIISEATYIFEPSSYAVAAHLERSMMQIALSQLILESKLAQYASRFRAMSASHQRSQKSKDELHLLFNRAKRAIKDERLKEIVNGIKKSQVGTGA